MIANGIYHNFEEMMDYVDKEQYAICQNADDGGV